MKKLLGYFIKGLLFITPIAVTIYVFYMVFDWVDGLLHIPLPGVGFVTTIILVTAVGYLLSGIFGRGVLNLLDSALKNIPFIKLVYTSLKDLTGAFAGEKKIFDRPVMVALAPLSAGLPAGLPESNIKILGFITRDDLTGLDANLKDNVAVYVPQAYNFAGNLIIVHKDQVTPINKPGPEVMALIVSAGISGNPSDNKPESVI